MNTEQPVSSLLGCQLKQLARAQFFIHQNPQLLRRAILSDSSQSVPMSWITLSQVNLLNFLLSFSWTLFSSWTQISCHCKIAEGALNSAVHVSNEGIEEHSSQSPEGHYSSLASMDIKLLIASASFQSIPHPLNSPPFQSICLQPGVKDAMQDHTESLTELQADDTGQSSLDHRLSHPIIEGHHQAYLPSVKLCWLSWTISLSCTCLKIPSMRICDPPRSSQALR